MRLFSETILFTLTIMNVVVYLPGVLLYMKVEWEYINGL